MNYRLHQKFSNYDNLISRKFHIKTLKLQCVVRISLWCKFCQESVCESSHQLIIIGHFAKCSALCNVEQKESVGQRKFRIKAIKLLVDIAKTGTIFIVFFFSFHNRNICVGREAYLFYVLVKPRKFQLNDVKSNDNADKIAANCHHLWKKCALNRNHFLIKLRKYFIGNNQQERWR